MNAFKFRVTSKGNIYIYICCKSTNATTTKASMVHLKSQKLRRVAKNSADTEGGKIQS